MTEIKEKFDIGNAKNSQKRNPAYRKAEYKVYTLKKRADSCGDIEEKKNLLEKYRIERQNMLKTQYYISSEGFKSLKYVRYADDFIIGINGSKNDCVNIKQQLKDFLSNQLKLELSAEKTLITYSRKTAKFLGYDISVVNDKSISANKDGIKMRNRNKAVRIAIPKGTIERVISNNRLVENLNSEKWMPKSRPELRNLSDLGIVNTYNDGLRGLYNYYRLAVNVSKKMWQLKYIMEYSCLKTLATKHKSTVRKTIKRLKQGEHWGVRYQTKTGTSICYFYNKGFIRNKKVCSNDCDIKPNLFVYSGRTELEQRINAKRCEWCKRENISFEIHHVHRLKDLKGEELWEQIMISRKRKTLVLCEECHRKIAHLNR